MPNPLTGDPTVDLATEALANRPGQVPGYELLEEIGRGGMGVVYRARDARLDRDVAVKLLGERVAADAGAASRFLVEARITGQLQHPGIPAVHELGTLPDGRPFLAMKLVKGQTLQALLDESPTGQRSIGNVLAIFEQLCHAVGFAHAHRVLHRDLKPANVMVGAFGEVQVMDWGLAKVLRDGAADRDAQQPGSEPGALASSAAEDTGATVDLMSAIETPAALSSATRTGSVLGTPAYMSPEQAGGEIGKLDARSDVFGLGAVLCQILTGRPPYQGANVNEVRLKAVRGETAEALARLHAIDAETEIVALCKHCLAVRREDRPADGMAVAMEVGRIRQAAEERARRAERERAEAVIRAAEERKRRRQLLVAAGAIGAVLLLGIGGTTVGMVWADHSAQAEKQAKEQTQRRLVQIEKGVDLLASLLNDVNPRNEAKAGPPLYAVLARRASMAADELEGESIGDPLAVARLQAILGDTLWRLGNAPKAVELLEKARVTQMQDLGPDHAKTVATLNSLASAYLADGKLAQAVPLFEKVLGHAEANLGPEHRDTILTMNNVAEAYRMAGKFDRALPLYEETLRRKRATFGPDDPVTLIAMSGLAECYRATGRLDLALPLIRETLELSTARLGPDHVDTIAALGNLANVHAMTRKFNEALPLFEKALELTRNKLGAEHPDTLKAMSNLAACHKDLRQFDKALPLLQEALRLQQAKLGDEHPDTLMTMANLASTHALSRNFDAAVPLFEKTVQLRKKSLGPDHPGTLKSMNDLVVAYDAAGKAKQATTLFEELVTLKSGRLGPQHPETLQGWHLLARAHHAMGNRDRAIAFVQKAADGMEKGNFQNDRAGAVIADLVGWHEEGKQFGPAETWRRKWLAVVQERSGVDSATYASELTELGSNLLQQGKLAEAETILRECVTRAAKFRPPAKPYLHALATLVQLYETNNKPVEAERWRLELEEATAAQYAYEANDRDR